MVGNIIFINLYLKRGAYILSNYKFSKISEGQVCNIIRPLTNKLIIVSSAKKHWGNIIFQRRRGPNNFLTKFKPMIKSYCDRQIQKLFFTLPSAQQEKLKLLEPRFANFRQKNEDIIFNQNHLKILSILLKRVTGG